MKSIIVFVFVLSIQFVNAQNQNSVSGRTKKKNFPSEKAILVETDKIFDKITEIRRKLHSNPELAGNEKQTQETLKQYLQNLGIEVKTDVYGYGVVGILRGTKKGKNIAWRAEMDALPNDFPDNVSFKSTINGVQHGCGHDVHMAIALGIAEVLAKNKNSLNGTVYFIFQPEEETFVGAKGMLESNFISNLKLNEIYGLHVTALPVGQIMVKPNEMFAYQKKIRIELKSKLTDDEINKLSKNLYASLFRSKNGSKPWELQHITNPEVGLGNPNTSFADYLILDETFNSYSAHGSFFMETYLYETNSENLKNIIPKVEKTIQESGYGDQIKAISFTQENPTIQNDPQLTKTAIKLLENAFGKGNVVMNYGQVPFFNDDFAYFQQKTRGVYFFLGGSNLEKGMIAMNHAPNFMVDEECMRTGINAFSMLLLKRLNEK